MFNVRTNHQLSRAGMYVIRTKLGLGSVLQKTPRTSPGADIKIGGGDHIIFAF
jgi:hypothetical protein